MAENCMNSELRDTISGAYAVPKESLKKIIDLFQERIGKVSIDAHCKDGIIRKFSAYADVKDYENPVEKKILSLSIRAESVESRKMAQVSFEDSSLFVGIRISMQAREDVVLKLRTDLFDILAGVRPWYALAANLKPGNLVLFSSMTLYLVLLILLVVFAGNVVPKRPSTPRDSALGILIPFGICGILILLSKVLERFQRSAFPRSCFLIGQECGRYAHSENVRWVVVIGFIISLLAGVVTLFFQV